MKTPHYLTRLAAGVIDAPIAILSAAEQAAIDAERVRIAEMRYQRKESRRLRFRPMIGPEHLISGIRCRISASPAPGRAEGSRHIECYLHGSWRRCLIRDAPRMRSRWHQQRAPTFLVLPAYYHGEILVSSPSGDAVYDGMPSAAEWREIIKRERALWRVRWRQKLQRRALLAAAAADPRAPDTLGWRAWHVKWDGTLVSPNQLVSWHTPELRATAWSDSAAMRGQQGVHARRMPSSDWKRLRWVANGHAEGPEEIDDDLVTGVVERFGRYVLGTTGWRAEIAVIRELLAPDVATALRLMQRYPDVRVHVFEQQEEI